MAGELYFSERSKSSTRCESLGKCKHGPSTAGQTAAPCGQDGCHDNKETTQWCNGNELSSNDFAPVDMFEFSVFSHSSSGYIKVFLINRLSVLRYNTIL